MFNKKQPTLPLLTPNLPYFQFTIECPVNIHASPPVLLTEEKPDGFAFFHCSQSRRDSMPIVIKS